MKQFSFIIIGIVLCISGGFAQSPSSGKSKTFQQIEHPDPASNAYVRIFQDKRIEKIVMEKRVINKNATAQGYRVQVFSSNVQREAKNRAYSIEKDIREKFPEHDIYVSYNSPFWKVRVGDFLTIEEAQEFQAELIKTFPNLKKETYPVVDQINAGLIK